MKSNIVHKRSGCYPSRYPSVQRYCLHRHCSTQLHCRRRLNHSWPGFRGSTAAAMWGPPTTSRSRSAKSQSKAVILATQTRPKRPKRPVWYMSDNRWIQQTYIDINSMDVFSKKPKYRQKLNGCVFKEVKISNKSMDVWFKDVKWEDVGNFQSSFCARRPRSRSHQSADPSQPCQSKVRTRHVRPWRPWKVPKNSGFIIWPG